MPALPGFNSINTDSALVVNTSFSYVGHMKTMTTREFFHSPGLVKSLRPGQSFIVTDKGEPAFTVIRAGQRRIKTAGDLEREAREIFPGERSKVNFTAIMKKMKK